MCNTLGEECVSSARVFKDILVKEQFLLKKFKFFGKNSNQKYQNNFMSYTYKIKGTFWGTKRAIWTFKSFSDQLDSFWLSRESHFGQLIDPKQLYLRLYLRIYWGSHGERFWIPGDPETCKHVSGSPGDPKWFPRRSPLNTEVWLPPESHFGSSSFICILLPLQLPNSEKYRCHAEMESQILACQTTM